MAPVVGRAVQVCRRSGSLVRVLRGRSQGIGVGFCADPCGRCYYHDIGMVCNLVTRGGAIVTLAFALMLGRILVANGLVLGVILILIPINEKMFFYDAAIWLFFLFAMTRRVEASMRPGTVSAAERARPA